MKITSTIIIILTLFSLNTFAQEIQYTVLSGHTSGVTSVAFSPDGNTLASGSWDDTIRIWDVATGSHKEPLRGNRYIVYSVAFSPDGNTLASASGDTNIRLWDVATGRLKHTLTEHWNTSNTVAFSPDGNTIASGSDDATIMLWDVATGTQKETFSGHIYDVNTVAFSPDGNTIASGSDDASIRLWDVATGTQKETFSGHRYHVNTVAFSPDGTMLASGGWDRTIRLWDVATGTQKETLSEHTDTVRSVAFSPDGTMLASGGDDITIRLWNVATGSLIQTLRGHRDSVYGISFSPDETKLASASADDTIRLWRLPAKVSITPSEVESPTIGERISINVSINGGENVGGYQLTLAFDSTALLYVESTKGDYLKENSHFVPPVVSEGKVTLGATTFGDESSGDGILANLTFEVVNIKESRLVLSNVILTDSDGERLTERTLHGKIVEPAEVEPVGIPSSAVINLTPTSVISPTVGGEFTFTVNITGAQDMTNYHLTWGYDDTALTYVSSSEIYIGADSVGNSSKTLGTRTFKVRDVKPSTVNISGYYVGTDGLHYIPTFKNAEVVTALSTAVVSITPTSVLSPAIKEELTFTVNITGGQNVKSYRLYWHYESALLHISGIRGNYLDDGIGNGDGTLFTGTFRVRDVKDSTISVAGHLIGNDEIAYIPTFKSAEVIEPLFGDVNRDGVVDIADLVQVGASFGQTVTTNGNPADVNEDNTVNIVDIVMVAAVIGSDSAAPTALYHNLKLTPTRADVQKWLKQAQHLGLTDAHSLKGIQFLKRLIVALTPKETALLANYPNPFNPETWIPYQLAKPTDVKVTIYTVDGEVGSHVGFRACTYRYLSASESCGVLGW